MRRFFLTVFLACLCTVTFAQEQGMQFFHGSWDEAKTEAKKKNKLIFMDAYASWCGPCKRMAAEVFTRPEVGDYYNKYFINYKMDMEKGEGPALAQQFAIRAYPTLLYFDSKGNLVHRALGGRAPNDFIQLGEEARHTETQLYGRIEKFKKGERDTAFLHALVMDAGNENDQLEQEVLKAYWKQLKKEDFIKPHNWEMFVSYDKTMSSPAYLHIRENRKAFAEKYGADDLERTLLTKAAYAMEMAAQTKDEKLFRDAQKVMTESSNEEANEFGAYAEIQFYRAMGDWDKYKVAGEKYFNLYARGDAEKLNRLAWDVYTSKTTDQYLIAKAIVWARESVAVERAYYNLDTYATLLYAGKKYKEAENAALDAIDLAKKAGEDYSATQELIEKIWQEKK